MTHMQQADSDWKELHPLSGIAAILMTVLMVLPVVGFAI